MTPPTLAPSRVANGDIAPAPLAEESRLRILLTYVHTGNIPATAKHCGVSAKTVRDVVQVAESAGDVERLREALRLATVARLVDLRDKALGEIEQRLTVGESHFDGRTGRIAVLPVRAVDALRIFEVLSAEIAAVNRKPQSEKLKGDAKLLAIAEELQGYIDAKANAQKAVPKLASEVANAIE